VSYFTLEEKPFELALPDALQLPPDRLELTEPAVCITKQPGRNHWQAADAAGKDLGLYHYDPFRRVFEASRVGIYKVGLATYPVGLSCRYYDNWRDSQTPGLGVFRVQLCPRGPGARDFYWIYIDPHGRETPTSLSLERFQQPPALPRPPAAWKKCGCGTPHTCSACGRPYFLEIHGVADGSCTYCYYAG
jgi:hypothetical protein